MLLLTDGRVLVHSEPNCGGCISNYNHWYTLTPDNTGSYINGTWKQVTSLRVATIRCSLVLPSSPMAKWWCKAGNTIAREAAITSF